MNHCFHENIDHSIIKSVLRSSMVCSSGITGPTGPTGPQGIQGPTGPTGADGSGLGGLQVQLQTGTFETLDDENPVLFNTVITNASPNITYNPVNGEFTITDLGLYYINWWLAVDSAPVVTTIIIAISTSAGQNISTGSNFAALNISGNALLNVTSLPFTFTLENQSGGQIFINGIDYQGDLTVIQISGG